MDLHVQESRHTFITENRKKSNSEKRISFSFTNNDEQDSEISTPRSSFQGGQMSPSTPSARPPIHASQYNCLSTISCNEGSIVSIALSNSYIFTGSQSKKVYAWSQSNCIQMGQIQAKHSGIRAIFSHGKRLFTTHSDHKLRVWNVSQTGNFSAKKIITLPLKRTIFTYNKDTRQHKDTISCIAYYISEKLIYTGSWDRTIKVWKVLEKDCVDSFSAHEAQINAIAINQQDGCVFTCSSDFTIKIWRRIFLEKSHILTMTLKWQSSPVNALSLNDCFLYSGSSDGLISVWKKEKEFIKFNHKGFLHGHNFGVLCLVSINNFVVSGSEDSTIRVWRREKDDSVHTCVTVIEGHRGPVKCLAVKTEDSVFGLLVYSASLDQTLRVWRVRVYASSIDYSESTSNCDYLRETAEGGLNPVLSPLWVEMKVQHRI